MAVDFFYCPGRPFYFMYEHLLQKLYLKRFSPTARWRTERHPVCKQFRHAHESSFSLIFNTWNYVKTANLETGYKLEKHLRIFSTTSSRPRRGASCTVMVFALPRSQLQLRTAAGRCRQLRADAGRWQRDEPNSALRSSLCPASAYLLPAAG